MRPGAARCTASASPEARSTVRAVRRATRDCSSTLVPTGEIRDIALMIEDVLAGLAATPKQLPCRLLWDARGDELFDQICTLDEYYLTRHALGLLREHLPAIARTVGPHARVEQQPRLVRDAAA